MTDPDWEPVLERAAAIVTDQGGRTCHAAIVSRELGIPCVVGTGDATARARDRPGGHGLVRRGRRGAASTTGALPFAREEIDPGDAPRRRACRSC